MKSPYLWRCHPSTQSVLRPASLAWISFNDFLHGYRVAGTVYFCVVAKLVAVNSGLGRRHPLLVLWRAPPICYWLAGLVSGEDRSLSTVYHHLDNGRVWYHIFESDVFRIMRGSRYSPSRPWLLSLGGRLQVRLYVAIMYDYAWVWVRFLPGPKSHTLINTSKPCDIHNPYRSHSERGVSSAADPTGRVQDLLLDNSCVLVHPAMVSCVPP